MNASDIHNAPSDHHDEILWQPLVQFFKLRYDLRYFNQIDALQNHSDRDIRNNCGFLIVSIDCMLVETLEQYYAGTDSTTGKNHDPFITFFLRSPELRVLELSATDIGRFAGIVRSTLLHQSKTGQATIINKKSSTPILGWVHPTIKKYGFVINRDKFHNAVKTEFKTILDRIQSPEEIHLRESFKRKLLTLI